MALLSVDDALALILEHAHPLPAENAPLIDAYGRVLAADLKALRTQPPEAVSAMDGYAVRAADVATAPIKLKVVGEVPAGKPFDRPVGAGEAARIFTGGFLPTGTDTIVIQENTTRDGDAVTIGKAAKSGANVRVAGLDFRQGEVLFETGHRLAARDLALAAGMNHPALPVYRRPKVAVLATGDELVPPGTTPGPGQIVYSNGFSLIALYRSEGADVVDLGVVRDRMEDTVAAIRRARDARIDVLVTTGGASVGDYDLVQKALGEEGVAMSFWKIAMRPGRPMMHGRIGEMDVLGLPGNPVSSYVCSVLFVVPLIRRLSGRADAAVDIESALLGRDMGENDERRDYMRATLTKNAAGELVATPFAVQDSSMTKPLAKADCLVIREIYAPPAKAGERCDIVKLAF